MHAIVRRPVAHARHLHKHYRALKTAHRLLAISLAVILGAGVVAAIGASFRAGAATATELPVITGLYYPTGVAFDSAGNLFVVNFYGNSITVVPAASGTIFGQSVTADIATTLSAASGLDYPTDLAFDAAGDLFIANSGNSTVTVVPKASGTIFGQSVTAGTGVTLSAASGLAGPYGLAFDSAGDLFIANYGENTVTVVPKATGAIFGQSVTADSAATLSTASSLDDPIGLDVDASGDLFVVNYGNNAVAVVPAATGTIFGQSVTADTEATLTAASGVNRPTRSVFDSAGDLFIADEGGNAVTVVPAATGTIFGQSATLNTAATLSAATGLDNPYGLAFDAAGDLFVAEFGNNTVTVVPMDSDTVFGQSVTADTSTTLAVISTLSGPTGIAVDASGDVFIANEITNSVRVIPAATGTIFGQSVTAGKAVTLSSVSGLDDPHGLAFDSAGDLFIANQGGTVTVVPKATGTIFGQSVTADTAATLSAATGLDGPIGIAFDAAGDLFIDSYANNTIQVVPVATGTIFGQSVTANTSATLSAATGLSTPFFLAFDGAGDLFIENSGNNSVTVVPKATGALFGQSVTANTAATLSAVSGLNDPDGIAVDGAGDLFVASWNTAAVTVVPAVGGTIFGQSVTANTSATLGAATGLNGPLGLTFDANGNLYITSYSSNSLDVVVNAAPAVVTSSLSSASVGTGYSATVEGTGGVGSDTWSLESGSLPAGLSLSASRGVITGTPSVAGLSSFTIAMTDSLGEVATRSLSVEVAALPATTTTTEATSTTTSTTTQGSAVRTGSQVLDPALPPSDVRSSDLGAPSSVAVGAGSDATVTLTSGSAHTEVVVPGGALPSATVLSVYPVKTTADLSSVLPVSDAYVASVVVSWRVPDGSEGQASAPVTFMITDSSIRQGDSIYELLGGKLELVGRATRAGAVTAIFTKDPAFVVSASPHLAPRSALSSSTGSTVSYRFSCVSGASCTGRATLSVERLVENEDETHFVQVIIGQTRFSVKRHATRTITFVLTPVGRSKLAHLSTAERFRLGLVVHVTGGARRVRLVYVGTERH